MKKLIILIILLVIPLVNSLTLEQKNILEKTLDTVNTKSDLEKLMNVLDKQNIDLSNEKNIIDKINSLAKRYDADLALYPNIKGLDIEFPKEIKKEEKETKINWIQIIPVIFIIIFVLIVEIYRFKNIKEEAIEETSTEIPIEEQLKNYIEDAIAKGYTKEEIKKILIENNWDENIINNVLRDF